MSSHRPVLLWNILMGEAYNLVDRANQHLVLVASGWPHLRRVDGDAV